MPLDALTLGEVQQLQYFSVVYLQEGIDRLNPGSILGPRDQFPLPEQVLIMNECRGSWGQYTGIKIEKLQTNVKGTIVHAFKPNSTQFSPSPLTLTYRLVVGQGTGTKQCVLKVEVLRSCNFADISHVNWGKTEGKIEAKTSIPAPSRGPTILMTAQIWTMVLKDCKPAGPKSRSRNLRTDLGNGSEALKGLQDKEPGDIITVSKARMRSGNKIQDIRQNCKSSLSAAPANLGNGSRQRWVMGQSKVEGYWPSESPRLSLRSEFSQHARVTWSKELEVQDTE
ncbi:hypothetical protein B0H16DRAFT_1486517 [Mycena metata]|uniref:Uncharacterized protein n=1 Tax=Mycena metata TaxID=1033252 RepID=A0AAD7GIE1_9AGAR|nr:hypothetical protein B0H16DRAFT_1486517 [Mycena metata]